MTNMMAKTLIDLGKKQTQNLDSTMTQIGRKEANRKMTSNYDSKRCNLGYEETMNFSTKLH
jgi:hypothetical protein